MINNALSTIYLDSKASTSGAACILIEDMRIYKTLIQECNQHKTQIHQAFSVSQTRNKASALFISTYNEFSHKNIYVQCNPEWAAASQHSMHDSRNHVKVQK